MPLVIVNCGALPEGTLESELFGHERGAFTGAQFRHKGKFELADGGTLFLDEIGEISQRIQVELLRVLEEKRVVRMGGHVPVRADFMVVIPEFVGADFLFIHERAAVHDMFEFAQPFAFSNQRYLNSVFNQHAFGHLFRHA